jgi:hypothetical protein
MGMGMGMGIEARGHKRGRLVRGPNLRPTRHAIPRLLRKYLRRSIIYDHTTRPNANDSGCCPDRRPKARDGAETRRLEADRYAGGRGILLNTTAMTVEHRGHWRPPTRGDDAIARVLGLRETHPSTGLGTSGGGDHEKLGSWSRYYTAAERGSSPRPCVVRWLRIVADRYACRYHHRVRRRPGLVLVARTLSPRTNRRRGEPCIYLASTGIMDCFCPRSDGQEKKKPEGDPE